MARWTRRAVLASGAGVALSTSLPACAVTAEEGPPPTLDTALRAQLAGLEHLDGPAPERMLIPGRPVLLSFVATWCAPCWIEMYNLARLSEGIDGRAGILAVNQLEDWGGKGFPEKLPLLLKRGEGRFPVMRGDVASGQAFDVSYLPYLLVYDHRGMLLDWREYRSPPINRVPSLADLRRAVALAWET